MHIYENKITYSIVYAFYFCLLGVVCGDQGLTLTPANLTNMCVFQQWCVPTRHFDGLNFIYNISIVVF